MVSHARVVHRKDNHNNRSVAINQHGNLIQRVDDDHNDDNHRRHRQYLYEETTTQDPYVHDNEQEYHEKNTTTTTTTNSSRSSSNDQEELPYGVGRVPLWWMECTPHNLLDVEQVEQRRRVEAQVAFFYMQLAAADDAGWLLEDQQQQQQQQAFSARGGPDRPSFWDETVWIRWMSQNGMGLDPALFGVDESDPEYDAYLLGEKLPPGFMDTVQELFGGGDLEYGKYGGKTEKFQPTWVKKKLRPTGNGDNIRKGIDDLDSSAYRYYLKSCQWPAASEPRSHYDTLTTIVAPATATTRGGGGSQRDIWQSNNDDILPSTSNNRTSTVVLRHWDSGPSPAVPLPMQKTKKTKLVRKTRLVPKSQSKYSARGDGSSTKKTPAIPQQHEQHQESSQGARIGNESAWSKSHSNNHHRQPHSYRHHEATPNSSATNTNDNSPSGRHGIPSQNVPFKSSTEPSSPKGKKVTATAGTGIAMKQNPVNGTGGGSHPSNGRRRVSGTSSTSSSPTHSPSSRGKPRFSKTRSGEEPGAKPPTSIAAAAAAKAKSRSVAITNQQQQQQHRQPIHHPPSPSAAKRDPAHTHHSPKSSSPRSRTGSKVSTDLKDNNIDITPKTKGNPYPRAASGAPHHHYNDVFSNHMSAVANQHQWMKDASKGDPYSSSVAPMATFKIHQQQQQQAQHPTQPSYQKQPELLSQRSDRVNGNSFSTKNHGNDPQSQYGDVFVLTVKQQALQQHQQHYVSGTDNEVDEEVEEIVEETEYTLEEHEEEILEEVEEIIEEGHDDVFAEEDYEDYEEEVLDEEDGEYFEEEIIDEEGEDDPEEEDELRRLLEARHAELAQLQAALGLVL